MGPKIDGQNLITHVCGTILYIFFLLIIVALMNNIVALCARSYYVYIMIREHSYGNSELIFLANKKGLELLVGMLICKGVESETSCKRVYRFLRYSYWFEIV